MIYKQSKQYGANFSYFSKLLDREKLGRATLLGEDYKCLFRYGVIVWC